MILHDRVLHDRLHERERIKISQLSIEETDVINF